MQTAALLLFLRVLLSLGAVASLFVAAASAAFGDYTEATLMGALTLALAALAVYAPSVFDPH